jgi:hypothetical protein
MMLSKISAQFSLTILFLMGNSCGVDSQDKIEFSPPPEIYEAPISNRSKGQHLLVAYEGSWGATSKIRRQKDDAQSLAQHCLDLVQKGASFSKLVLAHSDDPSKGNKGQLGVVQKGDLDPTFEEALFLLNINQSQIVETKYGFHVLQRLPLEEIYLIHIVTQWKDSKHSSNDAEKETALDAIEQAKEALESGSSPTEVATQFSDGPLGSRGGEIGWIERSGLHQDYADIVFELQPKHCSTIIESRLGFHIFCRENRVF